jgi:pilus assembly protein Flp/PilA
MLALIVSLQNRLASLRKEEGQAMVEYGLIIALIAILLVVSLTFLKDELVGIFNTIGNALTP